MKKLLISILSFLTLCCAWADNTNDNISLDAVSVNPDGNEVKLTVILNGVDGHLYSSYNMDIHLPEGIEPLYNANGNLRVSLGTSASKPHALYPSTQEQTDEGDTEYKYTHTISASYNVVGKGVLRVACISNSNEVLKSTSGNLFTFFVKYTNPYTKPGTCLNIPIDGITLKVAGGAKYVPAGCVDKNVNIGSTSSVSISIKASNKWSTCIFPFSANIPQGVKVYTCNKNDDENLLLEEANSIEAYTPYILYSENDFTDTFTGTVDALKYPTNGYVRSGFLNGAIEPQTAKTGEYVMQKKTSTNEARFYVIGKDKSFTIPSGRCWVSFSGSSAKSFAFAVGGNNEIENKPTEEETAISTVIDNSTETIYTLQGIRVNKMRPGNIYIKGGKRVFVKDIK